MRAGNQKSMVGIVAAPVVCSLVVLGACSTRESLGRNLGNAVEAGAGGPVPTIPTAKAACPRMAGLAGTNVTFLGNAVTIWSGPAGSVGPMVFYWHATNATSEEALSGLGPGTSEVMSSGGVVAAFNASNGTGTNTGDFTWYTGDFTTADEILACAKQQGLIDVSHIHSAGYSWV